MSGRPAEPDLPPGRDPRVSVVICAYTEERWEHTLAAVDSVRGQSLAAHETILVVDHNRALQDRLRARLPEVIVTANSGEQGLSAGKNTGVSLAAGEIIAFLDDDAVAEPGWLKALAGCYDEPAVMGAGGRTTPMWETRRPRWFPAEFDWVVGCSYAGMPLSPAPVRNLLGGNASFRREVFDAIGGFRTGIGRSSGGLPLGCEETEFCIRLGQRRPGWVLRLDGGAVIGHRVPVARCRFSYFVTRCYAEGLSKAQVTRWVGTVDGLSAERRHIRQALPRGVRRGVAQALRGDLAGLGRAGAIAAGLAAAAAGYASGSLGRPDRREPEAVRLAGTKR